MRDARAPDSLEAAGKASGLARLQKRFSASLLIAPRAVCVAIRSAWKAGRRLASAKARDAAPARNRSGSRSSSGAVVAAQGRGSIQPAAKAPGMKLPIRARPPCSVVNAKRPVARSRWTARRTIGTPAASSSRAKSRRRRAPWREKAAATASGRSTRSISCRIATANAYRRPAEIGYARPAGSRRRRTASDARATVGTSTQLSCATTPEKAI